MLQGFAFHILTFILLLLLSNQPFNLVYCQVPSPRVITHKLLIQLGPRFILQKDEDSGPWMDEVCCVLFYKNNLKSGFPSAWSGDWGCNSSGTYISTPILHSKIRGPSGPTKR